MMIALAVLVVPIWLHNRDIVRDFFDDSILIASAGKIEAGLKPYTGVRSPMQSSVYLLNYASEVVAGRSYLGLTWGGLVQALGGAWLIFALLARKAGTMGAFMAAAAVALAGLTQHVLFFYNPVGILCFSVVVLGLAMDPALKVLGPWRHQTVLAALFVGGINKLNFHGAALVLGGMIVLAAWVARRLKPQECGRSIALLAGFGLVLPLAFELAWTGATFRQWLDNVVLMPTARRAELGRVFDPAIYLHPVHDFHHHILVPGMGGIGLLLLVALGLRLAWATPRGLRSWHGALMLLLLLGVGALLGALLMITNHESVLLTSLPFPVLALAILLARQECGKPVDLWMRGLVGAALMLWATVGGYATWHGSRVLYAQNPPPRSAYVEVKDTTGPMSFFRGVKMLPEQWDAYARVIARLDTFRDADGRLTGVLFGPGFEWMERVFPESIVPLAPVWYHAGTTLAEGDAGYFRKLLDGGRRRLVTQKGWEAWPGDIRQLLAGEYRAEAVNARDLIYHPRRPELPMPAGSADRNVTTAEFRQTGGNIMLAATLGTENLRLDPGANGTAFGAAGSSTWAWPAGARAFQGRTVARWLPDNTAPQTVHFRIIAGDPDAGELLWEASAHVTAQQPVIEFPFSLQANGRPVWLQTVVGKDAATSAFAGWREVRITHAADMESSPTLPFDRKLVAVSDQGDVHWFGRPSSRVQGLSHMVPLERWQRYVAPRSRLEVTVTFEPNQGDLADPVVLALVWYRAGRFEIITEQMFDLRKTAHATLTGGLPEPYGWVGLIARPAGGEGAGHRVRLDSWELH